MKIVTLIFYLTLFNEVTPNIVEERIRNLSTIEKCIENIIKTHIQEKELFITYVEIQNGDSYFLPLENTKIILNKQKLVIDIDDHVKSYLIVAKYSKMENILFYLKSLYSWNNKAKFLLVSYLESKEDILTNCWKYHLTRVVVLETNDKLGLFSWDLESFCDDVTVSKYLGSCTTAGNLNATLFQSSYIIDWTKCTLKIAAMEIAPYVFKSKMNEFDGIEVRAVKTIQEKMGFEIVFLNHTSKTWGLKTKDGNYSDLFGLLQKFEVDIVMGMWPTNFSMNWDFDITFSYFEDALVWLVPKAELQTHWKSISKIFDVNLWFLLVTLIFVQGILWKGVTFILENEEALVFTKLKNCLLFSLAIIFNMSINKYPKTVTLRVIFSSWVYATLIVVSIYQSKLIASLTKPSYEFQISNIQELLNSKLSFGGNINLKNIYNNSFNPYEKIINERLEICDLSFRCINRTAFEKDFAVIKSELPSKYLIIKYYTNPDGTPMIYIFKNKVMYHFVAMVFSPNHPIFSTFDKYLFQMFEAGFFNKWLQDIKFDGMKSFSFEDNKILKLTLRNMAMPFVILFVGLGISTMAFFFECVFSWIKKITHKNLKLSKEK